MAKGTGASGSFVYNGTSIGFNSIEVNPVRVMDDASDSTNYDTGTNIVHKSQLPVSTQTTISIEGKIDLTTTPLALVAPLYGGATAVPAAVKYSSSTVYGHGLVDITDFKATIDTMKVLSFTATLISNGVWTPNA